MPCGSRCFRALPRCEAGQNGSPMWCWPGTSRADPCSAYGWFVTYPVLQLVRLVPRVSTPHAHVPALSSLRPADRGTTVRCGGWGEGAAKSAGLVLASEACQGCCPHMAVRPTELCPPMPRSRSPNRLRGSSKRCWTCADPSAMAEIVAESPTFRESRQRLL